MEDATPKSRPGDEYDLLIVTDATGSMSGVLTSLHTSLPQIISISTLTAAFSQIGLLAYREYDFSGPVQWLGWRDTRLKTDHGQPNLTAAAKKLHAAGGGGDRGEALKTGLAKAYEVMREDVTTIILIFTDSAPHLSFFHDQHSHGLYEQRALSKPDSYGGYGPHFRDWVSACKMFRDGQKRAQVYCILSGNTPVTDKGHYVYMSHVTGGACLYLDKFDVRTLSSVTIEILLAWMGAAKAGIPDAAKETNLPGQLASYSETESLEDIRHERDITGLPYFMLSLSSGPERDAHCKNINLVRMTVKSLQQYLPKRSTPVLDFAKRWASDAAYRAMAVAQLEKIINEDVRAITLNPVFGSLWRTVCNDRSLQSREKLVNAFGYQVDHLQNAEEKVQMRKWLEESYDYTAEVLEKIHGVPEAERFPCVCFDPTLNFTLPKSGMTDIKNEDTTKPITSFTRDELLEIGRSCDWKILRRLGAVLTQLTYIDSEAELPEHIAEAPEEQVPRIPLALTQEKYGREFWRILLHVVVPGTLLSARPATLLAALAIRLGLTPLIPAADRTMALWRDKWNDIEVPENWNVNCLSLILDADQAHFIRQQDQGGNDTEVERLIKPSDRELFEELIQFRFLELNLETVLTARVGWKPQKTTIPIGPLVMCRLCHYPRSVTMMGNDGTCGLCLFEGFESAETRRASLEQNVTVNDTTQTPATWVECAIKTCRAQYVVYNVQDLRVRAKCHYCRQESILPTAKRTDTPAPMVECRQCLSRMIWPHEYRPKGFQQDNFCCLACSIGHQTIVNVETNAKTLSRENSMAWLVTDTERPGENILSDRSLFHIASTIGTTEFTKRIKLFPKISGSLLIDGKQVRNIPALVETLQNFVLRRRVEKVPCSLCFEMHRVKNLRPACGRHGCTQRICGECLMAWYGLNHAGQIINTAALSCPFCRRLPSGKTLNRYGMGIRAVANLSKAVEEQGQWIYAWCQECGTAKQYMERVCARGTPEPVVNWTCEDCQDARSKSVAKAKPCPECGVMTEKKSGCDHITCPVAGCGAHWCYFCGEASSHNDIYKHMNQAHGGLYEGGGEDEWIDDEEDWMED